MKRFTPLLLLVLMLASCLSSRNHMNRGDFEGAVEIATMRLKRNPSNQKEMIVLERAYPRAVQKDLDQITFLKKEGRPDNFEQIFHIYKRLKARQDKVLSLSTLRLVPSGRIISFERVNYDDDLIGTKQKTAEVYYAKGIALLDKGDRFSAREAHEQFEKANQYIPGFRDVNAMMGKARAMGVSYVLFAIKNRSGVQLPPDFETEVKKISLADLNQSWLQYETTEIRDRKYDFTVFLNLQTIAVSPETVSNNKYTQTLEVEDGWKYELDTKGNVRKDSAGNDIKVKKYKIISCNVVEALQKKSTVINGSLDYFDNSNNQLIRSFPVTADAHFNHLSAMAFGDLEALKPETRKIIGVPPAPFPDAFGMLMMCADRLKGTSRSLLYQNRGVLR